MTIIQVAKLSLWLFTYLQNKQLTIEKISVVFFFSEIPDFSVHILPKGDIRPEATEIHGLEKRSGRLFLRGDPIPSVTLYQALEQFQSWILKYFYENSAVLVIHFWYYWIVSIYCHLFYIFCGILFDTFYNLIYVGTLKVAICQMAISNFCGKAKWKGKIPWRRLIDVFRYFNRWMILSDGC